MDDKNGRSSSNREYVLRTGEICCQLREIQPAGLSSDRITTGVLSSHLQSSARFLDLPCHPSDLLPRSSHSRRTILRKHRNVLCQQSSESSLIQNGELSKYNVTQIELGLTTMMSMTVIVGILNDSVPKSEDLSRLGTRKSYFHRVFPPFRLLRLLRYSHNLWCSCRRSFLPQYSNHHSQNRQRED